MNDLIKAKVIVTLLDDRKYSVLSSFTDDELERLNAVDLAALHALTADDIDDIVSAFLADVGDRASTEDVTNEDDGAAPVSDTSTPIETHTIIASTAVTQMVDEQPAQLLACVLPRLDDEKKAWVLSHISEEKKRDIELVQLETTPVSDQVVTILINELDRLSSL